MKIKLFMMLVLLSGFAQAMEENKLVNITNQFARQRHSEKLFTQQECNSIIQERDPSKKREQYNSLLAEKVINAAFSRSKKSTHQYHDNNIYTRESLKKIIDGAKDNKALRAFQIMNPLLQNLMQCASSQDPIRSEKAKTELKNLSKMIIALDDDLRKHL